MKTPSLEEVREYFKNAKEVRCLFDGNIYDVSSGKYEFVEVFFGVRLWKNHNNYATVYKDGKYAEIISYKEKIGESAKKNLEVKQYKHIPTGKIVESSDIEGFYSIDGIALPNWLIENSSDWEEVITNPVLFTTEDGVEIRQGDNYFAVQKSSFDILPCHHELENPEKWATFSSKSLAEEYVLHNKPCFSYVEVTKLLKEAIESDKCFFQTIFRSSLVKLAKSKIND